MNKRPKLNQRGVALFSTIVAIFLFVGMAVVAIDVGHLAHTATEVQTAAEVAATAGATKLINEITPIESGGGGNTCVGAEALALADARAVVDENRIAGVDLSTFSTDDVVLEVGRWNDNTGFTPSTLLCNAVRATVTANNVPNIVAGIWGDFTSNVTKVAVAGVGSVGTAGPDLPLMIGECCPEDGVTTNCAPMNNDCSNPIEMDIIVPDGTMNTGWTDWTREAASTNDCFNIKNSTACPPNPGKPGEICCGVQQFLPDTWCSQNAAVLAGCPSIADKIPADNGGCGIGEENPQICTVSTCSDPTEAQYNLQESQGGIKTSPWIIADGVLQGNTTFTIPVMDCEGKRTTKSLASVIGFATIQIDPEPLKLDICTDFSHPNLGWQTKRFHITFLCNANEPGPIGGGTGGLPTGPVILLQ